jgi:hypothetical protein
VAEQPNRIEVADILAVDASVQRTTRSEQYGLTRTGFLPKPFGRVLAERIALARELIDADLDLTPGSAVRKLLELSALEDARTWTALATIYDNSFVASASGDALSRLGDELGLPRPYLEAHGRVRLSFQGALPAGTDRVDVRRGSRLMTAGGHHVAVDDAVSFTPATPPTDVSVIAFYPGPDGNLDSTVQVGAAFPQKIDRWHPRVPQLVQDHVRIEHTQRLTGGGQCWADDRYRELLLRAPRSLWTADAIRVAVSQVPGVRQVQVRDAWGGLDINQSIFGNFHFIERLFGTERDLGSPYYFTVLVAPTHGAIWEGDDGLEVAVATAIEDLRPIGIFPDIKEATEVEVGLRAELVVEGIALPTGGRAAVNSSPAAVSLKARLLTRLRRYVDALDFGTPVRWSEVVWALMNEPGIADLRNAQLLRYPARLGSINYSATAGTDPQPYACGANVDLLPSEIAVASDDASGLTIV